MDIFFPTQTLSLFQAFSPCFTAPSFAYFQSYMWALMVVEGRKCLTRLARCAFFHQRDLSSWERFLAEHRWSLSAVTDRLVTLVVSKLGEKLQVHGAYLLGKDTTLVAKTAKRMPGVQKWKDHSDNADRGAYLIGHHWNLVGLISQWKSRWLCWPLVMRLVPGLKGARQWIVGDTVEPMSFWDAAIAAILELTRCLGEASIRVVADAYYSKAPFLNGLLARGIHVISRLRKDAGGWDDPEPRPPGTRGRKPRHGRQWTLASLLSEQTPTRERLTLYGQLTEVVFVTRDVWLRDVAQKGRVVVLEGAKEPFILVSTDLTLSALQIIEIYGARFSIELTIRDLKQHFGLGDYQCTTTLAILRFVHLACLGFCLWRLALLEHLEAGWLQVTAARVSLPEAPLSFQRVRRALRAWATRQIIFANATPGADMEKIERDHEPLLQMLM
jgi:DDE superfamily endonuclease